MGTHHQGPKSEVLALDAYIKLMRAADSVTARAHLVLPPGVTLTQFAALEALPPRAALPVRTRRQAPQERRQPHPRRRQPRARRSGDAHPRPGRPPFRQSRSHSQRPSLHRRPLPQDRPEHRRAIRRALPARSTRTRSHLQTPRPWPSQARLPRSLTAPRSRERDRHFAASIPATSARGTLKTVPCRIPFGMTRSALRSSHVCQSLVRITPYFLSRYLSKYTHHQPSR